MRIIQINEDEKSNEQHSQSVKRELRNSSLQYITQEQLTDSQSNLEKLGTNGKTKRNGDPVYNTSYEEFYGTLIDEDMTFDEEQNELVDENNLKNIDEWKTLNLDKEFSTEEYAECEIQDKDIKKGTKSTITVKTSEGEDKDEVDHHDSDTESFYNIWGDDEEWLYGNKLRNVVRNIHR